jgi:hypothetical protein
LALPADSFSSSRISFAVNELPWATFFRDLE